MRTGIMLFFLMIFAAVWQAPMTVNAQVTPETLADENGRFITVDGLQIYYLEEGPTDAPAVLLLHGFGGSTFSWRDNIEALADAGYRVIAFDRPPFGLSDKRPSAEQISSTGYAELTISLMDALNIDSAVLVGHSAGGGVIAHTAALYPERVEGLVFVAGAVDLADEPEPFETPGAGGLFEIISALDPESPVVRQIIRTFLSSERFSGLLTSAYHPSFVVSEEITAGYGRALQVEDWEVGFLTLFSQGMPAPVDSELLRHPEIRVLLIWGQDDTWVPLARGERLRTLFPAAEWIVYPDVGHMPMEEAPARFNADLLAFIADIEWK